MELPKREIKFRVWNKEDCGFMENVLVGNDGYPLRISERGEYYEIFDVRELYILSQYTGLKDKNGKEIYEGDIVREGNANAKVEFKEEGIYTESGYEMVTGWFFGKDPLNDFDLEDMEVIGNIFENPELI